jgi:DNA-binding NarL/FixJ family response regulator
MIRAGLKALIDGDAGMAVVGEAANGAETVAQVAKLKPDVLVLDVSMPKLNGVQVTSRLKEDFPQLKILALSVHEDRGYLREMLEAGASGYALKRAAAEELQRAIRVVASGGIYVDPSIAGVLVKTFVQPNPGNKMGLELSEREAKVLRMIADGYSTKEIAAAMGISAKTVETYKARSMEKLGLKSRVDIVGYAKQVGWFHG